MCGTGNPACDGVSGDPCHGIEHMQRVTGRIACATQVLREALPPGFYFFQLDSCSHFGTSAAGIGLLM